MGNLYSSEINEMKRFRPYKILVKINSKVDLAKPIGLFA